jgi:hypothetical protein
VETPSAGTHAGAWFHGGLESKNQQRRWKMEALRATRYSGAFKRSTRGAAGAEADRKGWAVEAALGRKGAGGVLGVSRIEELAKIYEARARISQKRAALLRRATKDLRGLSQDLIDELYDEHRRVKLDRKKEA